MPFRSFSNFRALRRALRYLSAGTSDVRRIFAVFTDTTSRITNFHPTPWNDPLRVPSLPGPGQHQFPPIFIFSSLDIYSRVLNHPMCISSPEYVAHPDRLLKFGRAGWYSAYFHGNVSRKANLPQWDSVLRTVTSKLLSTSDLHLPQNPFNSHLPLTSSNWSRFWHHVLHWLSAPIHWSLGADCKPSCSSYEDGRGAPLLANRIPKRTHLSGSVGATHTYVWANPFRALVHYVRGGIVEVGFKGELITKIICLTAMDKALNQIPVPRNQWHDSRSIPVSDFLNHLIVTLRGYSRFSEGLKGVQDRDNIQPQ